uniref:Uncharacterized protein n=1 Tax=Molossus molossus TaxID=27622 RepID=A0A7J8F9L0_MOLMO|nr:hypothetical protein HJG59_008597 [Molossus molossus]
MRGSRSFLLCWPVSPERSERASCPRGRGRANLAAAFWGWMELGPPVSLMGVQAARQSVLSCAWGPHPETPSTLGAGDASVFTPSTPCALDSIWNLAGEELNDVLPPAASSLVLSATAETAESKSLLDGREKK